MLLKCVAHQRDRLVVDEARHAVLYHALLVRKLGAHIEQVHRV